MCLQYLYFPLDKSFLISEKVDTSFRQIDFEQSVEGRKVIIDTTYDGLLCFKFVPGQKLYSTLQYAKGLKARKKIPIETVLKCIPRFRPLVRQHLPPFNVSLSLIALSDQISY